MAEYRLSPAFRRLLLRRVLTTSIPLLIVALAAGLGVTIVRAGDTAGLKIIIPLLVAMLGIGIFRGYRRGLRQADSYWIVVTEDQINGEVSGISRFTLDRSDVTRIEEHASGEITLRTTHALRGLRIPFEIERREQLLDQLAGWRPIEPAAATRSSSARTVASLAVITAFAFTAISENRTAVAVVGSLLFASLITCAALIWHNRQLDMKARRLAFFVLLPAIAVLARVIAAIKGT